MNPDNFEACLQLVDSVFKLVVALFEVGKEFLVSCELDQEHYLQSCGILEALQNTFSSEALEDTWRVAVFVLGQNVLMHVEDVVPKVEQHTFI